MNYIFIKMKALPAEETLHSGLDTNTHSTSRPVEKSRTLFEKVLVARLAKKVAVSIPDRVIGIFHLHNLSYRTMVLGLIQPPTEMSTRNISWELKAAGAYG